MLNQGVLYIFLENDLLKRKLKLVKVMLKKLGFRQIHLPMRGLCRQNVTAKKM